MNVSACCQWFVMGCWMRHDWQGAAWYLSLPLASACSALLFEPCVQLTVSVTAAGSRAWTLLFLSTCRTPPPTGKPYLNPASGICSWSKKTPVRLAIRYQSLCGCAGWVGGWAVDAQAPWEARVLSGHQRVRTEGMVHLGARAGCGEPAAKCFEKERDSRRSSTCPYQNQDLPNSRWFSQLLIYNLWLHQTSPVSWLWNVLKVKSVIKWNRVLRRYSGLFVPTVGSKSEHKGLLTVEEGATSSGFTIYFQRKNIC